MSLNREQVLQARSNAAEQLDEIESAVELDRTRLRGIIAKLDDWLWENTEHTAPTLVAEFIELRDQRAELKKKYEAEDEILKEQMSKRDTWLLNKINADGLESIRTEHGTAYTQDKTRYNVADWGAYWTWIGQNNRFDLLEKRPAQGPLSKMEEEGEEMPPGINRYKEKVIVIRRT